MPAAPAVPFLILVLICFTGKRPRAPHPNSGLSPPMASGIFLCCFFLSTVIGNLCPPRCCIMLCFKGRTLPYYILFI